MVSLINFFTEKTFIIGEIYCIAGTPDSKFVVSASRDKSIKIFDIATAKEVYHFKEVHNGKCFS